MKKLVTVFALLAIGVGVQQANAQIKEVTIREINAIPPDSITALDNAGLGLTEAEMIRRIFDGSTVDRGDTVRVGAVVLSNPRNSGLATPDGNGIPGRIHIFIRDTSSVSMGNEGMGIQIVDGNFQTTGTLDLFVGDVIELIAQVAPFGETMQLAPISYNLIGEYQDLGLPATILDPIVVTTADINKSLGAGGELQPNWQNLVAYRQNYVRFEGVTIAERTIGDRPAFLVTSDGGTTGVLNRDMSLRYRNERENYSEDFNKRPANDDFVPPPPGSVVNLQGFLVLYDFDPFNRSTPFTLMISPFEDADLELLEAPPIISNITRPAVPGASDTDVTADVVADPVRTITGVSLSYYTSASPDTQTVAAGAPSGDTYGFTIPAAGDGDYVTFWVEAMDNTGAMSRSNDQVYLVLVDGINGLDDLQTTRSGGEGDSPFAGSTVPTSIEAVVQTDGATTGLWAVQDNASLDPWSGAQIRSFKSSSVVPALGDQITITELRVVENFNLTLLDSVVVTVNAAGTPYPHKVVGTDVLQDPAIAEAHEGMLLRFENVTITNNDEGFGEWSFSSDGTPENAIKADDSSSQIPSSFATDTFENDDVVTYIQGLLSYTFGEYKLFPMTASDVGDINVGVESEVAAGGYVLRQNFPNPFSGLTSIQLAVPKAGNVELSVYDVLGRKVVTLVDAAVPAGEHVVEFDRKGLASGLYFYRLSAGERTLVRTMTVVN